MGLLDGEIADIANSALGDIFLDATLERDVVSSSDPADPDFSDSPASYSCKAIRENYGVSHRSGGLVKAQDVKILILQLSLSTTPQALDRITIVGMGGPFTIVSDGEGQPAVIADPANATWECRARS